jgi:hypothetical protein
MTIWGMNKMPENSLVGYCGLYCGDCHGYTGSIADLARDLRKELRKNNFNKVAEAIPFKEFDNYPECYECLGAMVKLRCEGCRDSSRSKYCEIAKCARENEYMGCWQCDEFETCGKFDFLKPVHKDANIKNLKNIKKKGIDSIIEGKRYF